MFVGNKGRERNKTLNGIRDCLFPTNTHTHTHIYLKFRLQIIIHDDRKKCRSLRFILFHCYNQIRGKAMAICP